jgi:anaerobic selenocysteine-containing dehydrogenase
VGIDAATLLHSRNIILWGYNPSDTRFDCEIESVLQEVSKKGIPILPSTDSAFMLAILWVLIEKNLLNRPFIDKYSSGFELMEQYIKGVIDGIEKSPPWAEKICGISEKKIRQFAEDYASFPITALLPGLSLQRAIGGENADLTNIP